MAQHLTRRKPFETPYHPEAKYIAQLRKYAKNVAMIINSFPQNDPASLPAMKRALEAYQDATRAWAASVALTMLKETQAAQCKQWEARFPRKNTVKNFTERYHAQTAREARKIRSERLDRHSKPDVGAK